MDDYKTLSLGIPSSRIRIVNVQAAGRRRSGRRSLLADGVAVDFAIVEVWLNCLPTVYPIQTPESSKRPNPVDP
jgi:hypothetical protein